MEPDPCEGARPGGGREPLVRVPLCRIRRLISILNYVALFPFVIDGGTGTLRLSRFVVLKMFLVLFITLSHYVGEIIAVCIWKEGGCSVDSFSGNLGNSGKDRIVISKLSFAAYVIMTTASLISMELFYLVSFSMAKPFSDIFLQLEDFAERHHATLGRVTVRSYLKLIIVLSMMLLLVGVLYPIQADHFYFMFFEPACSSTLLRVSSIIIHFASAFMSSWTPPLFGVFMFFIYMVECAGECYDITAFSARSGKAIFCETLRMGYSVTKIVEDINTAFSSVLVIIYSLVLVITVANIYNLIDIFFNPWHRLKAIMFVRHLSENVGYVTSLAITSHCGQRLENRRSEARRALEDMGRRWEFAKREEEGEHDSNMELDVLLSRMGSPGPISPHHFFAINHAGFLAMVASIVTYIIVLVQFKTTEK